jgi:hypothetical protein
MTSLREVNATGRHLAKPKARSGNTSKPAYPR